MYTWPSPRLLGRQRRPPKHSRKNRSHKSFRTMPTVGCRSFVSSASQSEPPTFAQLRAKPLENTVFAVLILYCVPTLLDSHFRLKFTSFVFTVYLTFPSTTYVWDKPFKLIRDCLYRFVTCGLCSLFEIVLHKQRCSKIEINWSHFEILGPFSMMICNSE